MARLTMEQQAFLIDQLAMWQTPTEAARSLQERFGVEIPRAQAAKYIPGDPAAKDLAPKWIERFAETRARFREEVESIPIANRAYRIQRLSEMEQTARSRGNLALAAQLLEQAAKEVGGSYTNEQRINVRGKVKTERVLTDDEKRATLAAALADAIERAGTGQGETVQ